MQMEITLEDLEEILKAARSGFTSGVVDDGEGCRVTWSWSGSKFSASKFVL